MTNTNNKSYTSANTESVPADWNGVYWYDMPADEKQEYLNRWRTESEVVSETPAYRLRCFRKEGGGVPVLIDPPCSAHDSKLMDWDKGQSLVQCAIDNTDSPVYGIDYKGYTPDQGKETYEDIVNQVIQCIETIGGKAHLISLCQSGVVGSVVASIRPDIVESLTVAGSPINPKAEKSILSNAIAQPMWMYEMVVGLCGGYMSGKIMLNCWMSSDYKKHYVDRFSPENEVSYRSQRFASWYYHSTQDLGIWYLEAVKNFKTNDLFEGRTVINGETVKFENIECRVNSVYADGDQISPKLHAIGLKDKVVPEKHFIYQSLGGHIGIFMSRKSISTVWPSVFESMK